VRVSGTVWMTGVLPGAAVTSGSDPTRGGDRGGSTRSGLRNSCLCAATDRIESFARVGSPAVIFFTKPDGDGIHETELPSIGKVSSDIIR